MGGRGEIKKKIRPHFFFKEGGSKNGKTKNWKGSQFFFFQGTNISFCFRGSNKKNLGEESKEKGGGGIRKFWYGREVD